MTLLRSFALAALLLGASACSKEGDPEKQGGAHKPHKHWWSREPGLVRLTGNIDNLQGLYQGTAIGQTHQMCVIAGKDGQQHFAILVRGHGAGICSGSGTIARRAQGVRLMMAGESPCTIDASIGGRTISLPAHVPSTCSYYCGAGGSFDGASLVQTGTTRKDALTARDVVGDSLCVDEEG